MTIADERLMQQVRDLQNCVSTVEALLPKRVFNTRTGREGVALGAQTSQSAVPELVSAGADGFLQLDYEMLGVFLVGAVKDINARLKVLEDAAAPAA